MTETSNEKKPEVEKPLVYTGGGTTTPAGTGSKGTGAAGTKTELSQEYELESNGLPKGFFDWSMEQQQDYLKDPDARAKRLEAERKILEGMRNENEEKPADENPVQTATNTATAGGGPSVPGTLYEVTQQIPDSVRYAEEAARRANNFRNQQEAIRAGGQSGKPAPAPQTAPRRSGEERAEERTLAYNPAPTAEGQEDFDIQVRILKDRGYSQDEAERMAREEFGNYSYSGDMPSYVRRDVPKADYTPGDAMQSYLQEGRDAATAQGLQGNEAENYAVRYANERMAVLQNAAQMTDAEAARRRPGTSAYYYEPVPGTGTGSNYYAGTAPRRSGEERAEERTLQYIPPTGGQESGGLTEAQRRFEQEEAAGLWSTERGRDDREQGGNPNRPGADAALEEVMNNGNQRRPDSVRYAEEAAARRNDGSGTGTAGSQSGSNTGSNTGTKSYEGRSVGSRGDSNIGSKTGDGSVPKGSQYFTPSYGQEMEKGVKAPYRKGGYTAEELQKMGNAPRTDFKYNNGKKAYEGYYLAPDGNYYPIDQDKANYYRRYGTYDGWEEGMRDYWKNFGTFYGYRPDWKNAGRGAGGGGGRSSGGGGYSYSGGRSSGGTGNGKSYGAGSTANNGLYWNPNSSWSI